MQQSDRCLHLCLLGDSGVGQSSFLQCYKHIVGAPGSSPGKEYSKHHPPYEASPNLHNVVSSVELDDGGLCRVRLSDGVGGKFFSNTKKAALGFAHAVLVCFRSDNAESLEHLRTRWLPLLWSSGSDAPWLLVALATDARERKRAAGVLSDTVSSEEAQSFAQRFGAWSYVECSAFFPETVQLVVDEAVQAASAFYRLQWQIHHGMDTEETQLDASLDGEAPKPLPAWTARPGDGEQKMWLMHEKLNVHDDPTILTEDQVKQGLSQLGETGNRVHAYLRCDIMGLSLTSLVALRPWAELQFLNVSRNQLRSLEPVGCLRRLLHLNASHNLLIRSQCFTAPDALETVDMSYNMIAEVGDWKVHRYLRELNLRGNFISKLGPGLKGNKELRMLDLSENHVRAITNLDHLEIRTLVLAQNRLSDLEGVAKLAKLTSLDARHNAITTLAALRAEDIPRLRKLNVTENRISQIREMDCLASFSFLSDLALSPNPMSELPHYRAQVLHWLPRLRSLDSQQVTAEERVKTDLIYGEDVETRKEIFEQLLPEETFVDRRLVTEEKIMAMEKEQFGKNGDAGPYGRSAADPTAFGSEGPARTSMQLASFRKRMEMARSGREGVADFANYAAPFLSSPVSDDDLPEILEAAAEGGVVELLLGAAQLSVEGVRELTSFLRDTPSPLRQVDLAGCQAVAAAGVELVKTFPFAKGCSLEAENCGLSANTLQQLRNQTKEASDALQLVVAERRRSAERVAEYLGWQEALEDARLELLPSDAPPSPPPPLCHPQKWRAGIESAAQEEFMAFLKINPSGLVQTNAPDCRWSVTNKKNVKKNIEEQEYNSLVALVDNMLHECGCHPGTDASRPLPEAFMAAFGGDEASLRQNGLLLGFLCWLGVQSPANAQLPVRMHPDEWEAAWRSMQDRFEKLADQAHDSGPTTVPGVASGQLIAQLSHLSQPQQGYTLQPPSVFKLKKVSESKRPPAKRGKDLHEALSDGDVAIQSVVGSNFGSDSLRLELRSNCGQPVLVAVRRGSIFQQQTWEHRQNLVLNVDYCIEVPADGTCVKRMSGFCMNHTCAAPCGNAMDLTDFYLDDDAILASQALVWDHFESIFTKMRAQ